MKGKAAGYLLSVLILVGAWQGLAAWLDTPAIPLPAAVVAAAARESGGSLPGHLVVSTFRVLSSLAIALAAAVPLGLVLGRKPWLGNLAAPLVYLTYPVPKIVFLPVFFILLGLGDLSKIALISLIVFYQILVTTWDAARGVNPAMVDSVTSLGAGEWDLYRHVFLPAVLPEVFTALRIATGTAIAVLFISETYATRQGLGYYLLDAWSVAAYPEMYAGILAMGLLGWCLYVAVEFLERRACAWRHQ